MTSPTGESASKASLPKKRGRMPLTFCVCIAQGLLPHVAQSDRAFAAAVHKLVAAYGVEDGGRDHFGQLLHVGGFDVHHVFFGERIGSKKYNEKRGRGYRRCD